MWWNGEGQRGRVIVLRVCELVELVIVDRRSKGGCVIEKEAGGRGAKEFGYFMKGF